MRTIDQTYEIMAPVNKVWDALTTPSLIDAWEAGPSAFDLREGGEFSLWGGDIHGVNTKIITNKVLEQDWYGHDSPDQCYKVMFSLNSENNSTTTLRLTQADVPDNEAKDFEDGWRDYYFNPIKKLLEV